MVYFLASPHPVTLPLGATSNNHPGSQVFELWSLSEQCYSFPPPNLWLPFYVQPSWKESTGKSLKSKQTFCAVFNISPSFSTLCLLFHPGSSVRIPERIHPRLRPEELPRTEVFEALRHQSPSLTPSWQKKKKKSVCAIFSTSMEATRRTGNRSCQRHRGKSTAARRQKKRVCATLVYSFFFLSPPPPPPIPPSTTQSASLVL